MIETDELAILAIAESWASIDGKDLTDEGGFKAGYIEDAMTMLTRISNRGFKVVPTARMDELTEIEAMYEGLSK